MRIFWAFWWFVMGFFPLAFWGYMLLDMPNESRFFFLAAFLLMTCVAITAQLWGVGWNLFKREVLK